MLCNELAIIWSLMLVKMHVARNNFSPVNVALTTKKVGQACCRAYNQNHNFVNDKVGTF